MGMAKVLREAAWIPRCPPRSITQQSLIIFPRDNGTGAPRAQGVCAELMEILPVLRMSPYIQNHFT